MDDTWFSKEILVSTFLIVSLCLNASPPFDLILVSFPLSGNIEMGMPAVWDLVTTGYLWHTYLDHFEEFIGKDMMSGHIGLLYLVWVKHMFLVLCLVLAHQREN